MDYDILCKKPSKLSFCCIDTEFFQKAFFILSNPIFHLKRQNLYPLAHESETALVKAGTILLYLVTLKLIVKFTIKLLHFHQILLSNLLSPHGVVQSFVFQQFFVRAIFYDSAFFQDKNLVGVHDG